MHENKIETTEEKACQKTNHRLFTWYTRSYEYYGPFCNACGEDFGHKPGLRNNLTNILIHWLMRQCKQRMSGFVSTCVLLQCSGGIVSLELGLKKICS